MSDMPAAPRALAWHRRHHGPTAPDECVRCQRSWARCRGKITYATREAVDRAVQEINEREEYREPVMRYPCRWGEHYHVAHARRPVDVRRARRAERKWRAASPRP